MSPSTDEGSGLGTYFPDDPLERRVTTTEKIIASQGKDLESFIRLTNIFLRAIVLLQILMFGYLLAHNHIFNAPGEYSHGPYFNTPNIPDL